LLLRVQALTTARLARAQMVVTPFVLQRELYLYTHSPAGQLFRRHTVARTQEGTKVEVETVRPLTVGLVVRRINYPDGRSVMLLDEKRTKTTWPQQDPSTVAFAKALMLNPPQNCIFSRAEETLVSDRGTVLGHPVYEVRHLMIGGRTRSTAWRARDLGCDQLQYRVEERQADGSYKMVSFAKAVSLRIEEPDPRLLGPGDGYEEVSPSESDKRALAVLGITEYPDEVRKGWEHSDKLYYQRK
jgi:hypothetical protein